MQPDGLSVVQPNGEAAKDAAWDPIRSECSSLWSPHEATTAAAPEANSGP